MLQVKQQILAGFKSCGYKSNLLKESYQYFDGKESKTAEIVGFSQPTYNSSTACIAAIDKTKLNGNRISSYQLLGCPVLLVCDDSNLQFWKNSGTDVILHEEVDTQQLAGFFKKYEKHFSPQSIYRAKTIGRVKKEYQLSFVDLGLMSIVEEQEGKYLSGLTEKIIRSLRADCETVKEDSKFEKWLFQAGFWLIGAKILKDKAVEGFKTLKISSAADLVNKVQGHYNAEPKLDISNPVQSRAIEKAAKDIVEPVASFAHLTTESLAYVYENTLTSKDTRKVLGTHATPSWLVNYIVWEMIDWIEDIPQEDRIILEPACGHAPFLTTGAKLLADPLLYKGDEKRRHDYLKRHLIGIDMDTFAEEIARLALTLADIPNRNGWNIRHSDIYEDDILKKEAQKATILFCNPPFENFSPEEKQIYGSAITTGNKAAEVLAKTLPSLPPNSVFGIVLPQGFLHKRNLADLRRYILDNFELRTICNLPDNVFAKGGHPSTMLLGRKSKRDIKTAYLRIPKNSIDNFKNTYQADAELVGRDTFYEAKDYSFRIPELKEVWDYCRHLPKLKKYVEIGRGIEYKSGLHIDDIMRHTQFPGSKKGFYSYEENTLIEQLPKLVWLNVSEKVVNTYAKGMICQPFILLNRIRSSRTPWRLRAWIDFEGHPCGKAFLTVVSNKDISLYSIWALLNSPFTNAYAYDHCMAQDNNEGILKNMPVNLEGKDLSKIGSLAQEYFTLDSSEHVLRDTNSLNEKKRQYLVAIDAEILRLYNLPPRLEKELLDFFEGVPRKGVDFEFDRYYEEGFESYIPLHMYISTEFQNSSVEHVKKWIESNRTPEVIEAFKTAAKIKK